VTPPHEWQPLLEALPWPALVLDADGRVAAANARAAGFAAAAGSSERERGCGCGPALAELLAPADAERLRPDLERSLAGRTHGGPWDVRLRSGPGGHADVRLELRAIGGMPPTTLVLLEPRNAAVPTTDDASARLARLKHDVNNQLMALLGHLELLRETQELEGNVRRHTEAMQAQCERMRDRIRELTSEPGSREER